MFTAASESLLRHISAVLAKLSLSTSRGPSWNEHWRSHRGVKAFKDRRLRHDRIAVLRSSIQAGLKWSMEGPETLNLEGLELEKKTRPPRQRRADKKKDRPGSSTNTDGGSLLQAFEQKSSARIREAAPTVSSSDLPPTDPLTTLANPWHPVNGGNAVRHNGLQTVPKPLRYHPGKDFVPSRQPTNTPYHQAGRPSNALQGSSTILNESSGPISFVQKSKLSVSAYHGIPSFRIDKQYRHTTTSAMRNSRKASSTPPPRARSPIIELPAPQPTPTYITQANLPPTPLSTPQPLLLVLDLNGTLLYRNRADLSRKPLPRPSLASFLTYVLTHHRVLIWSSAKPHNVSSMCSHIFHPLQRSLLLGEWARDTLGLTPSQYNDRVQVFKNLERIWNDRSLLQPQVRGGRWGQHNTLLIDDSAIKASAQPYNHILIPEFVKGGEREGDGKDVFGKVVGYLEEARKYSDVSAFGRVRRFDIEGGWSWKWDERRRSAGGNSKEKVLEQSTTSDEDDDEDDDYGGVSI